MRAVEILETGHVAALLALRVSVLGQPRPSAKQHRRSETPIPSAMAVPRNRVLDLVQVSGLDLILCRYC